MYNRKRILAVITARGGSKGLPDKNIRILNGKPLVAWTTGQADKSKYIDNIFVSTDSKEIADVCEKYGTPVPELRPGELAEDTTSSVEVLLYTISLLKERGQEYDYLLLLEPTSPLRKENDIDRMIETAVNNPEADGVISLGRVHLEHPSIIKKVDGKGFICPYNKDARTYYQRQLEDEAFFPYGAGYIVRVDRFMETKSIYMEHMLPYYIERWQNYEIDDLYDFKCIETIMKMEAIR